MIASDVSMFYPVVLDRQPRALQHGKRAAAHVVGMATLFLVRHAHVDGGSDSTPRLLGWTDVALSEHGHRERAALRTIEWRPEPVAIYSSPLQRALSTGEPIANLHRWPLRILTELREIDCGRLDGELVADVQRRYPELWHRNLRQDDADFRWPEGESYREFRRRVYATLTAIAERHAHDAAIIVTHTGVISQALGIIAETNPAQWNFCRPGCASITTVAWPPSAGAPEVLSFDDRSHLGGPAGRPLSFATQHLPAG